MQLTEREFIVERLLAYARELGVEPVGPESDAFGAAA
jgi:hypothetical protein